MKRPAITLIELLVVMIILTVLVAAAIPVMAPSVENRRIRETARGISTFLTGARSRAIEIGRPVGVTIERMESDDAASMALFIAEVPPPFGGFFHTSAIKMQLNEQIAPGGGVVYCRGRLLGGISPKFIRKGDTLRVNYQSQRYQITGPDEDMDGFIDGGQELLLEAFIGTAAIPWPLGPNDESVDMPYQIFRQPVRSAAPPYQVPDGAVIDLVGSGMDGHAFHDGSNVPDKTPITIVFSPSGSVNAVYHKHIGASSSDIEIERPSSGIFMLVGKPEMVRAPGNIWDPASLWVAIGTRTGQIGVAENNAPDITAGLSASDALNHAREFARDMRGMGGN